MTGRQGSLSPRGGLDAGAAVPGTREHLLLHLFAPVGLAWAVIAPMCFRVVDDSDPGWHLAQGRLIAQGGIPFENALAWTAPTHPWYPSSWLYDLVAYRITESLGVFGLQLLTFILAASALLLVALAGRQIDRLGAWVTPAVALLILPRITPRPHVAAWVVLAGVLALGLMGQRRGFRYRLACLPLLALGSNLHEGALFAAALCVLFCLEALWKDRRAGWELAIAAGAVLSMTANPGGLFILSDTVRHLWLQEVIRLEEYRHPTFERAPTFYLLIPVALALAAHEWKRRPVLLPTLALFALLGVWALRMVYEFELLSAAALAAGVGLIARRWGTRTAGLSIALVIVALFAARARYLAVDEWRAAFNESVLPVKAARFIQDERLSGPLYNAYNDGGFLEHAVPGLLVFQDGRCHAFPDDFFLRARAAEENPATFQSYLRDIGVEWVLASRLKGPLAGYGLMEGPGYGLVYWDETSELYLRRDVPRFAELLARLEYHYVTPTAHVLAALDRADRTELATIHAEADRFDAGRGDPNAALIRCGVEVRLRSPSAATSCAKAEDLVSDEPSRLLLARLQRPPAPRPPPAP